MVVFNLFTILFGQWAIPKHRKYLHYNLAWCLAFSVLFEIVITIFSLINLLAVIPRILLLIYQNFVANTLLPPAVEMPEPERSKYSSSNNPNYQNLLGNSSFSEVDEQQGRPKPAGRDAKVAGEWGGKQTKKKDVFTKKYMESLEN